MAKDTYYDVGHCKPPVSTRWQPGQSGNPKGRAPQITPDAKECLNRALSHRLDRPVDAKMLTAKEAIFFKLVSEAARGKVAALREVIKLMGAYDTPEQGDMKIVARLVLEDEGQEETRAQWLVKDNNELRRKVEELEAKLARQEGDHPGSSDQAA